ncbi:MAG: hypothetical protein ABR878_02295 [Roseiarcus sp.]|jgi:hypothetical protein
MPGLRTASALIALAWLVEGACAQQAISAAPAAAAAAPSPDSQETAAPEAGDQDDPTRSADWRERLSAARQRHADWLACIAAKRFECSPTPAAAADPMELLLNDDTLVRGDIVSTPKGLKVFRGRSGAPHSLADFD